MKSVRIPNSLSNFIAGNVYEPEFVSSKLAILCPGFLDTKDYAHIVALGKVLAEKEYTVVSFDPTGTWGSDGDISEYTTTQYLSDIKSVLEFMLKENAFDDILLGGHSRGGQLAILYAARDSRITRVLGIMPSYGPIEGESRSKWEESGVKTSTRDVPNSNERKTFSVPFKHVLDRDKYDALEDIKKLAIPIVLAAGEFDDVVPKEDVVELYDAANEPKRYILLKDIDHDYRLNTDEIEFVNESLIKSLGL